MVIKINIMNHLWMAPLIAATRPNLLINALYDFYAHPTWGYGANISCAKFHQKSAKSDPTECYIYRRLSLTFSTLLRLLLSVSFELCTL